MFRSRTSPRRDRRGVMVCTILALVVTGLVMMVAGVRHQTRSSTHRLLAHQLAVRDAISAAEAAVEESLVLVRGARAGHADVTVDGRWHWLVAPRKTRRLVETASSSEHLQVERVRISRVGRLQRLPDSTLQGVLEVSAPVRAHVAGALTVTRTLVRRYRFSSGPTAEDLDVDADFLCQWVIP